MAFTSCPIPSIVTPAPRVSRMGSQYGQYAYCQAYTTWTVRCGTRLCHPANPEKNSLIKMVQMCAKQKQVPHVSVHHNSWLDVIAMALTLRV